jgi:hypothetical protein
MPAPYAETNAQLLARFAAQLGCDDETVIHAALLCLSGALHNFRGSKVRFAYVLPPTIEPNGPRGQHVEDLIKSFRELPAGGTPPPPIHVVNGVTVDGNHRLHAAKRMGLPWVPAFIAAGALSAAKEPSHRAWLRKMNPRRLEEIDRLAADRRQRKGQ